MVNWFRFTLCHRNGIFMAKSLSSSTFARKRANRSARTNDSDEEKEVESKYFHSSVGTFRLERSAVEPTHWRKHLENIRKMRETRNAPVDIMGCDKLKDEDALPKDMRFQSLLALMLSSQTKDQVTSAAMSKLIEHGCVIENIMKTDLKKLEELIYPVSFYKTKAKNIKKTSEMLHSDFNGDIPKSVDELCKLPGVGPKMAHLTMQCAWGQVTGIAVDTHVHRISNRLAWVDTKSPLKTQSDLEDWVPRHLWGEINNIFVGFGQQICLPIHPKCSECLNRSICPFALAKNKADSEQIS